MIQTNLIRRNSVEFHVLLLEDDPDLAEILSEYLEAWHCVVTTAVNGAQGIHKILAMDFDFIICDMVMPGFPGDMFYIAVERVKPHLCARFIFLTGHQAKPGLDDFIRQIRGILLWKPFQLHDLLTAMKAVRRKAIEPPVSANSPADGAVGQGVCFSQAYPD